jgi:hypothetical protein
MHPSEIFQREKYVYLPTFLDVENCQEYIQQFKILIEEGKTKRDEQCPLSHSLGHTPLFDSLLEQLTPNMETATGKKLLPTYAYARWYAPGDELKIHKDRPACEISATITLGFEGNPWPIYMSHSENKEYGKKINMKVGDAVIYKGEELFHWREPYEQGQWQAQVFLHYVDANGPNAQEKFDKRKKLAHHTEEVVEQATQEYQEPNHYFGVAQDAFSLASCQKIIQDFESNKDSFFSAKLVGQVVDKDIRDTSIMTASVDKGIGATLTGIGLSANHAIWNFDITHSNQCEYLRYDHQGHFKNHIDTELAKKFDETRKLTIILFLNDEYEGGKLYLNYGHEKVYPEQKAGNVIIFPSFLSHGVEPITSGIRRTMVTWLVGPYFR